MYYALVMGLVAIVLVSLGENSLNALQSFIVVTAGIEKNFSKAAKRLFITQPSVSHAIKQLENELGIQLFTRTSKGVFLTKKVSASIKRKAFSVRNTSLSDYFFSEASSSRKFLNQLFLKPAQQERIQRLNFLMRL